MAQVEKPAGSGGTYTYTLTQAPAAAPARTIFSDAARTTVAAAAEVMAATANPAAFTGTYPLALAAGRYFLRHIFTTAGGATVTDDDDELLLVAASGSVAEPSSFATPAQLAAHLHLSVDMVSAQQALDGASALLRTAAGLTADPVPVPLDLRTWTLELAALIYENPALRESETAGDVTSSWGWRRRQDILADAALAYRAAPGPTFSFPALTPWPA